MPAGGYPCSGRAPNSRKYLSRRVFMDRTEDQNGCRRCGTCCENGGPALHSSDLPLLVNGALSVEDLITIRKGELVHDPVKDSIVPVKKELVKIRGIKNTWACTFYSKENSGCRMYLDRPSACRTLKCWDTADILDLAGKDLMSRLDIVNKDNPLRDKIIEHERLYPCPDLKKLYPVVSVPSAQTIKKLEQISSRELSYRMNLVDQFDLSISQEMFYFGRPVFQLLTSLGFMAEETHSGISLEFSPDSLNTVH